MGFLAAAARGGPRTQKGESMAGTAASIPTGKRKIIKLGTCRSVDDLKDALRTEGFQIGSFALKALPYVAVDGIECEIELYRISVGELGLEDKATRADVRKRGIELGLDLIPAEAGLQLRLQYPNQPFGERLFMAMEPIDTGEFFEVFCVAHTVHGLSLDTGPASEAFPFSADDEFVFAIRRFQFLGTDSVGAL
jgi:hypothetical protein